MQQRVAGIAGDGLLEIRDGTIDILGASRDAETAAQHVEMIGLRIAAAVAIHPPAI